MAIINSQTSYGMHKAGECISGQLNTSKGTTESHCDHRSHTGKILVKENVDVGLILLFKPVHRRRVFNKLS